MNVCNRIQTDRMILTISHPDLAQINVGKLAGMGNNLSASLANISGGPEKGE